MTLQLNRGVTEEFVEYLISAHRPDEAAERLAALINDDKYISPNGKTKHQVPMLEGI